MNSRSINWANDFGINEQLHYFSQQLSARYGNLYYTNQKHPSANSWNMAGLHWAKYKLEIKDMFLKTKEEADFEIQKLVDEYKVIVETEKSIN